MIFSFPDGHHPSGETFDAGKRLWVAALLITVRWVFHAANIQATMAWSMPTRQGAPVRTIGRPQMPPRDVTIAGCGIAGCE